MASINEFGFGQRTRTKGGRPLFASKKKKKLQTFKEFVVKEQALREGPFKIVRINKDTRAKVSQRFRGIINLVMKDIGLNRGAAIDHILNLIIAGVDPEESYANDIDKFLAMAR